MRLFSVASAQNSSKIRSPYHDPQVWAEVLCFGWQAHSRPGFLLCLRASETTIPELASTEGIWPMGVAWGRENRQKRFGKLRRFWSKKRHDFGADLKALFPLFQKTTPNSNPRDKNQRHTPVFVVGDSLRAQHWFESQSLASNTSFYSDITTPTHSPWPLDHLSLSAMQCLHDCNTMRAETITY